MYKKILVLIGLIPLLGACDKHDPILPGVRTSIFDTSNINVLHEPVPDVPENIDAVATNDCPYVQKNDNTIWDGTRKIFSGFATSNYVGGTRTPICNGGFVYAGLSTGEMAKINPKNRQIVWIVDVFRPTNMTGGASILDIVAPIQIRKNYVYVGGLGGAFCKVSDKTGNIAWCADIGVEKPFLIADNVAFVLDTDKNLNAVRLADGAIYWRSSVKKSHTPTYRNGIITVGSEKFNALNGDRIKS